AGIPDSDTTEKWWFDAWKLPESAHKRFSIMNHREDGLSHAAPSRGCMGCLATLQARHRGIFSIRHPLDMAHARTNNADDRDFADHHRLDHAGSGQCRTCARQEPAWTGVVSAVAGVRAAGHVGAGDLAQGASETVLTVRGPGFGPRWPAGSGTAPD